MHPGSDEVFLRSRINAYALWDSGLPDSFETGTVRGLRQIHLALFGGLYDFAGEIRILNIAKGGFQFAMAEYLEKSLSVIERMPDETFCEIADKYIGMNVAHPFMEGNGRSGRLWLDAMLRKRLGLTLDWSRIGKMEYLQATAESVSDGSRIKSLLHGALTDRVSDRGMFLRGIDCSSL